MRCLPDNQENNHHVEELARRLSLRYDQASGIEKVNEDLAEGYKDLAYYLLANNDGQYPWFDRNGNNSKVYAELKTIYGDDEYAAIVAKAFMYTPQFLKKYGDWIAEGKAEPDVRFLGVFRDEFKADVDALFPNAGRDSKDAVDLMLQDLLHSQVFGDPEINGYNPAINMGSAYSTIQEDCDNWINEKLAENPVPEEQEYERRNELRRQYYSEKMEFLFDRVEKRFQEQWGLYPDDDGVYKNPIEENRTENSSELTLFDVFEFRCAFLNNLRYRRGDVSHLPVLLQMFKDFLRGSDSQSMTENMMNVYIDLYKDSDLFIKMLKAADLLEYGSDGKPTKASITNAISNIKKNIAATMYQASKPVSHNNKFLQKIYNLWKLLKNVTTIALRVTYKVQKNNKRVALESGAIFVTGVIVSGALNINPIVPVFATVAIPLLLKYSTKQIEKKWHLAAEQSAAFHATVRDWVMSMALNQALGKSLIDEESGELKTEPGSGMISSIMFDMKHGKVEATLYRLLENITIQIKSARSRVGQQYTNSSQLQELEELKTMCQEAIRSRNLFRKIESRGDRRKNNDLTYLQDQERYYTDQFIERYIQIAEQKLDDAKAYLLELDKMIDSDGVSQVDVHKLMRIKTDIIGAYSITIPRYILSNAKQFDLAETRTSRITNQIDDIRRDFSRVLDKFINQYTEDFLRETAYKSINDQKYRQRLKDNMQHWFNSEINNGNVSVFDKVIFSPRTSQSPVVRMVHQKLAEIETLCLQEAGEMGALLEDIRKANRSRASRGFFNPMNEYAERDETGKFTGNFISDTNYGQYDADYEETKQFLKQKHGIKTLPNGAYIWEDGTDYEYDMQYEIDGVVYTKHVKNGSDFDRWQAYQTDLILWQAGAEKNVSGNYTLDSSTQPRVHSRYKYQYYLDRCQILGRTGVEILRDYNRQINELYSQCQETITYEKNGVQYKKVVPILTKLSPAKRLRLQTLLHEKSQLASMHTFRFDKNMKNIIAIEAKDENAKKMALKFYLWEQRKHQYYSKQAKPDFDLWKAARQHLIDSGATAEQIQDFENSTTQLVPSSKLTRLFGTPNKVEYDINDENTQQYLSLIKLRRQIKSRILSSNKNRTPDLMRLGDWSDLNKVKQLWLELVEIDQQIYNLSHGIDGKEIQSTIVEAGEEGRLERFDYVNQQLVPRLASDGEEIPNTTFKEYLESLTIGGQFLFTREELKYMTESSRNPYSTFLKYDRVDEEKALGLSGGRLFASSDDLYEQIPIGVFSESQSDVADDEYDNNDPQYLQVNKNFKRYDNTKQYNKIKDDPIYQKLLEIMDASWKNYEGFTRRKRYQMPQRLASKSSVFGRAFIVGKENAFSTFKSALEYTFHDLYKFNDRDTEVNEQTITRADGTIVETIPSRWIRKLDNPNMIDTDLISSVIDFYNESLRFKYRSQLEPVMEAMYFKLCGGYDRSSDSGSNSQAQIVRSEISRAIYGRNMTGFDENGRMSQDDVRLAKWSKGFRSLMHKRLMSHNWLSVLKNGYDSFCNLLTAAYTGKYILTQNLIRAIGKLIYDWHEDSFTIMHQLSGINRSTATNMTQALMQLNGVNNSIQERFKDQNKWYIRRFLQKSATLEFEFVDYTAKSIITESVYDAYRLVFNPTTNRYEFLNENQAEYAYPNRKDGYSAWNNAKNCTLRDCYYQDKENGGVAKLKDTIVAPNGQKLNVLDLIRPKSDIALTEDQRSHALENQVRTTIKQMCQTINGMLDEEDKNMLAKNYAGALLVSFRGWMISQSSEFCKKGTDFYDWEGSGDTGASNSQFQAITNSKLKEFLGWMPAVENTRQAGLENQDFVGQFNFATGTIDQGLHVSLLKNLHQNFGQYLQMCSIVFELGDSKTRHLTEGGMSQAQYYQLRNFAAATDFFILTIALTAAAYAWYDGDDDGEEVSPFVKQAKSLIFTAFLASISERFPQLGTGAFLAGSMDLVKAVTVGVTIFDDAHYLLDSAFNLGNYIQNVLTEAGLWHGSNSDEIDEDDGFTQSMITLNNGSFKGETKAKRDLIKALALFDVDTLPYLLAADAVTSFEWMPEYMQKYKYRDLHLNYRKSTTESSQRGLRKFYQDIIPATWVAMLMNKLQHPITDQKKQKESEGKSSSSRKKSHI